MCCKSPLNSLWIQSWNKYAYMWIPVILQIYLWYNVCSDTHTKILYIIWSILRSYGTIISVLLKRDINGTLLRDITDLACISMPNIRMKRASYYYVAVVLLRRTYSTMLPYYYVTLVDVILNSNMRHFIIHVMIMYDKPVSVHLQYAGS